MVERQTAIKVRIKDLIDGEYIQKEGWTPNFVRTRVGEVSRANIMAIIIEEQDGAYIADDSTGQIRLRTFEKPQKIAIGDPVIAIGRPREYAGQLFLNYEILRKVNPAWLEFRKKELELLHKNTPEVIIKKMESEEVPVEKPTENVFVRVLDIIRALDQKNNNQGAEIDEVIRTSSGDGAKVVQNLLEEGEIFEIKPGKLKVLE